MAQAQDTVWLPVLPSLKGFGPALVKGAGADSEKAGGEVGKRFGKALVVGTAAVGAAGLAAGAALYKVGEVFDDVADTIRVGTGATGKDLDGLVDAAKRVGATVPAEFEAIGPVVADVNTRMGLTGETLEKVASQYLHAGNILGEAVDVGKTSAAFNAFKIEGEDVVGAMDHLFQVSQATGLGMNELADAAAKNAPAMQTLGFSFQETTAMVGSFDKAGLNSSALMASMSKGLVTLAKDGEKPQEAFKRVQGEIAGFIAKGDEAGALNLASKVFGTRGATQFVGALKSGTLNLEDMGKVAGQTGDTIIGAGEDTMDFAEQWTLFKNKVLVWLEPMATKVFGTIGTLMGEVTAGVEAFGAAWEYNDGEITSSGIPGIMERLGFYARQTFDYITLTAIPAMKNLAGWISENAKTIGIVAGIITTLMLPVFARLIVQATLSGAAQVAAWAAARGGAIKTAALYVINSYKMVASWVLMGIAAMKSGAQTAAIWLMYRMDSLKAMAAMVVAQVRIVASWVAMSAAAVASGIKTAAVWTGTIVRQAVVGAVSFGLQVARVVAGWVLMGVQSLIHAGRMAAAWFIALGPVGWVIAAIIGLVALVIANWSKVSAWTKTAWRAVVGFIVGAWTNIKTSIATAWTNIKATFTTINTFIRTVLAVAFTWFRDSVITPVWNGIKSTISGAWAGIKGTFNAVTGFLRNTFAPAFTWLRDNVIKPVWDTIKNTISGVWNKGIKPIFEVIQKALKGDFTGAFQTAKDAIGGIWDGLKDITKKPIEFVINTVLNKGLIGAFNKVAGWIPGVKELEPVKIPGFARGGWTGPGSKYQEAGVVHADEFVVRKESQRSLARKAPGFLDSLNRFGAKALGYANGGLVHPMAPGNRGVSAGWHGYKGHVGTDYPAPVGTPVYSPGPGVVARTGWNLPGGTGKQVWINHDNGLLSRVHHLSNWLVKAGQKVSAGQAIGKVGVTGNTTGPHAHWGVMDGSQYLNPASVWGSGKGGSGGFYGGGGGGGFDPLSAFTGLTEKVAGWFGDKFPGGGHMVDIAKGVGGKLIGDVKDWATSKLEGIGDFASDIVRNISGNSPKQQVRGVAEHYGWSKGNQWASLNELIRRESSWNPNAANPNSSARGLFQKMTSLHGPIEATADGQAKWGLNYIKGRYGNPQNAINFHDRHGSYADGGLVDPRAILHDNGGILNPGLSMILNKTRKPESIYNHEQNKALQSLAALGAEHVNGGVSVQIVAPEQATASDYFRLFKHETAVMNRRGGRRG